MIGTWRAWRTYALGAPTAKMGLKRQSLGINFDLEAADGGLIAPSDQAFKTMREAARQLGLTMTEESSPHDRCVPYSGKEDGNGRRYS